jgi:hypothetical protein
MRGMERMYKNHPVLGTSCACMLFFTGSSGGVLGILAAYLAAHCWPISLSECPDISKFCLQWHVITFKAMLFAWVVLQKCPCNGHIRLFRYKFITEKVILGKNRAYVSEMKCMNTLMAHMQAKLTFPL